MGKLRPATDGSSGHWLAGQTIMWRYWRLGPGSPGLETVQPVRVIRDDGAGLVVWLAPSTPVLRPVLPDGRELRAVAPGQAYRAERRTRRDVWHSGGILKIAPTGAPWSVWLFWDEAWAFRGWYVNLEDVHSRDTLGIVTMDHVLDLLVAPDHSVRLKDENELEAAVEAGCFSSAEADRFRSDARAVGAIVDAWGRPFCDGWESWRPDPDWPVPDLPPDAIWEFEGPAYSASLA